MNKKDYIFQYKIISQTMSDDNFDNWCDSGLPDRIDSYLRQLHDLEKRFYKKYKKSIYYFL